MTQDQPNAESMVSVIAESIAKSEAQIKAAREMIALYAIRALLDGANVAQMARMCGLGKTEDEHGDAPGNDDIGDFMRSIGLPQQLAESFVVVGGSHSQNPICELHDFLGHALAHFIHDQHKKQGGER